MEEASPPFQEPPMPVASRSVIIVHPSFERCWPFTADHLLALWQAQGAVELQRLAPTEARAAHQLVVDPASVERLVVLGAPLSEACAEAFGSLREIACPWSGQGAEL